MRRAGFLKRRAGQERGGSVGGLASCTGMYSV